MEVHNLELYMDDPHFQHAQCVCVSAIKGTCETAGHCGVCVWVYVCVTRESVHDTTAVLGLPSLLQAKLDPSDI